MSALEIDVREVLLADMEKNALTYILEFLTDDGSSIYVELPIIYIKKKGNMIPYFGFIPIENCDATYIFAFLWKYLAEKYSKSYKPSKILLPRPTIKLVC